MTERGKNITEIAFILGCLGILFLAQFASAHTFTAQGNAQIDTAQSKFGGASGLFDGTGDFVTAPNSTDWDFGSATDFTISFWVRFNALGKDEVLLGPSDNSTGGWFIYFNNGATGLSLVEIGVGTETLSWSPSTATWYHVALARSGSTLKAYIDGTTIGTYTNRNLDEDGFGLGVGDAYSGVAPVDGWIDEFTLQNGTVRWTTDFTPPSAEDDPCVLTDVKVLLHMNGADASTTFTDSSTCVPAATSYRRDIYYIQTGE